VFLLVLGAFLLTLRAQRRRKKPLDPLGPFPAWTILSAYWYGPIYDTVIGPLAGLGDMTHLSQRLCSILLLLYFFRRFFMLWHMCGGLDAGHWQ